MAICSYLPRGSGVTLASLQMVVLCCLGFLSGQKRFPSFDASRDGFAFAGKHDIDMLISQET